MAELTQPRTETSSVPRPVRALLVLLAPLVCGFVMAAIANPGGSLWPWQPPMADLDVYLLAGRTLTAGGDIYALAGFPFIYPPIAAVAAAGLALPPPLLVRLLWTAASVAAVVAICHRAGLRTWRLSLISSAVIIFCTPVTQSLALGQVSIFLCAWIVLDLFPGRGIMRRRFLPQGWLVGLGAAIKLTPAIFTPYLFLTGRRRAAVTSMITFAVVGLLGLLVLPVQSIAFWGGLASGDTGLGDSIIYFDNQSIMGSTLRWIGLGTAAKIIGLGISSLVGVVGLIVGMRWYRHGEEALAVCLVAFAGLLASPVSWSHHFVWVVPLAVVLWRRRHRIAVGVQVTGWLLVAWLVLAPYRRLPGGDFVELTYTTGQDLLDTGTVLLGLALLVASLAGPRPGKG
ncbi:MAG: glycosyltransferase 87 family protein [Propionibacteriales bacterium]|nr:glycosyltransferase 87 family protein [Propionibacteriales bacterium]